MSIYDPTAGFTGTPDPALWAQGQAAIADARAAAGGASLDIFPGADFIFVDPLTGDPKLAEALEDIATVTRASKAWSMGWDGVNGNSAGAMIEHASGKSRWSPYGLQVAPSTENLITNPRGEGSAIPAVPTTWGLSAPGGTITPSGRGTQDGWPYVDVTINGTLSAIGYVSPHGASVVAIAGDTFTTHVGLALISGSGQAPSLQIIETGGAGGGVFAPITPTSQHRRWSITRPMTGGTPLYARSVIYFAAGVYSNAVYRIFTPVLTKTAYVTSPVLPPVGTPGASVKAADLVSIATSLGWYSHEEGTVVLEWSRPQVPILADTGLWSLPSPASAFFGRAMRYTSGTGAVFKCEATTQAGPVATSQNYAAAAGRHLTAMRWSGLVHKTAMDGVLGAGFTHTAAVDVPTELRLGRGGQSTGTQSSSPIHRFRYFPRALSDAELLAAATPYWSD